MPRPGLKPTTFWCAGRRSNHRSHPARALGLSLSFLSSRRHTPVSFSLQTRRSATGAQSPGPGQPWGGQATAAAWSQPGTNSRQHRVPKRRGPASICPQSRQHRSGPSSRRGTRGREGEAGLCLETAFYGWREASRDQPQSRGTVAARCGHMPTTVAAGGTEEVRAQSSQRGGCTWRRGCPSSRGAAWCSAHVATVCNDCVGKACQTRKRWRGTDRCKVSLHGLGTPAASSSVSPCWGGETAPLS